MKKWLLAAAVMALMAAAALMAPQDWLALHVAQPALRLLSGGTARFAFPLGEVICLLIAPVTLLLFVRAAFRSVKAHSASPLSSFLARSLAVSCAMLLSYMLIWSPLSRTSALTVPVGRHAPGDLIALVDQLSSQADALREAMGDALEYDRMMIAPRAQAALQALTRKTASVKAARYPEFFTRLNLAGLCFPWTGEAIVNLDEPLVTLPFAACHEAAHQLGYGREDEANYIAYRACLAGDVFFRYSGTLFALKYAADALRAEDPAAFLSRTDAMSAPVRSDFYKMNGFGNAELPASVVRMNRFSEAFLRLNGQDGLKSYGQVVDLLLAQSLSFDAIAP